MVLLGSHLERNNNWQGKEQRICTSDRRGHRLAATRRMRRGRMKIRCVRCQISGEQRTCSAEAGEGMMGRDGNEWVPGWTGGSQSQGAGGKETIARRKAHQEQTQGRARGRSTTGRIYVDERWIGES